MQDLKNHDDDGNDSEEGQKKKKKGEEDEGQLKFMYQTFKKMILYYDFMSLVMYPELKKRREFVHDAWVIAKLSENTELKEAIIVDPYFQLNRDDILQLLKTRDNHIINLVLDKEVNLHIQEDEGYKIVDFKGSQVN